MARGAFDGAIVGATVHSADALRAGLRPLADDWRVATRELFRELERALARARQRSSSAPRAEALRLRTSALVGIDALLDLDG